VCKLEPGHIYCWAALLIHDRKVASRTIDKELKTAGHEVADEGFNLPRGHEPHAGKFSVVAERSEVFKPSWNINGIP
jgi:hypothetical protein